MRPDHHRMLTITCLLAGASIASLGFGGAFEEPAPVAAPARPLTPAEVSLELIMSDPDWIGPEPENAYWADDGRTIYYQRKRVGEDVRDLFEIDLDGQLVRVVTPEEKPFVDVRRGDEGPDRRWKVYARNGDLFLKDQVSGDVTQLTKTTDREGDPRFLGDDTNRIVYERGGATYIRDLTTGVEEQIAVVRAEDDPEEKEEREKKNEKYDYLQDQQERLFDWVRERRLEREARDDRRREEEEADATRTPEPFYLGGKQDVRQQSLAPDLEWMLVRTAPSGDRWGTRDSMPNYVSDDGYVVTRTVRSKVGTGETVAEKLYLLDLDDHEQHEIDLTVLPAIDVDPMHELEERAKELFEQRLAARRGAEIETDGTAVAESDAAASVASSDDGDEETRSDEAPARRTQSHLPGDRTRVVGVSLPGLSEPQLDEQDEAQVASDADAADAVTDTDDHERNSENGETKGTREARPVSIRQITWTEDGARVALQVYSEDNKDRWIALVDLDSHELKPLHHLHDPAWIGWRFNEMGWLKDHETLWYLSEEDGYSHLYLRNVHEPAPRRLTEGAYEVSSVNLDYDGHYLYYRANQPHPGIYEIYRVHIETGEIEQLTDLGGSNTYQLSPDESQLLITHSNAMTPPELYAQANEPGAQPVRLTRTVSDEFRALPWVEPEIVAVPSRHGRPIYARVYTPNEPTDQTRPAVMFVHGAGYLQNADFGWSHYFREFMFHTLLVQNGYVVMDMDYRASAGYGRDWRTAIYRQMGTPELEDLEDGVHWLVEHRGVDPKRVGVYGGSYGGFLTLMAMFRAPDLFACGAALRPVTDWAHYNHGYTANILNTPMSDPEAYEISSPIEFAEGLKNPLLMCHGMQDDNVFFQDTVRLAQRLIELGKEDWEVAMYPVEPHAFENAYSWLDEYRRIFKLFETHLK